MPDKKRDFSEYILKTRAEAEDVIDQSRTMIEQHGAVSVDEVLDMIGLTGNFKDAQLGWRDLSNASVRPVRDGYSLDLPDTTQLT